MPNQLSQFKIFSLGMIFLVLNTFNPPVRVSGGALPSMAAAERRMVLEQEYNRIIAGMTDKAAFVRLVDLAARMSADNEGQFLDDLSSLIVGTQDSLAGIPVSLGGRVMEALKVKYHLTGGYPALLRFGSAGFRFDDKSNQVQHFWFSVLLAYHFGEGLADAAARFHEWNAPGLLNVLPGTGHGQGTEGDLTLSRQGIILGRALSEGTIHPDQIASWLQENL